MFDCAYTGIRICKSFLVKNLLYQFLDHLKFLHIRAFYLKQRFIDITVQWMPKQMISRVNCFLFLSQNTVNQTCPKCSTMAGYLELGNLFLFSISFVFSLESVMIMNNLIYNFIIEAFQGRVWNSIFYSGTKWQLKSFFQSPDGKFWLLPSVH